MLFEHPSEPLYQDARVYNAKARAQAIGFPSPSEQLIVRALGSGTEPYRSIKQLARAVDNTPQAIDKTIRSMLAKGLLCRVQSQRLPCVMYSYALSQLGLDVYLLMTKYPTNKG